MMGGMKFDKKWIVIASAVVLVWILAANTFFFLNEGESALVQRFGRIEGVYMRDPDPIRSQLLEDSPNISIYKGTGLKMKIPFIDHVLRYPDKFILYDSLAAEVITFDKHRLYFDNTAQWQIENPLRFYERLKTVDGARTRIDDILHSEMRVRVGRLNSYVLISDRRVSGEMLNDLADAVNAEFTRRGEGIRIHDIRIRRTDLPIETYQNIYTRMITERDRIAQQYRSEGDERLLEIRSETDREVITITSRANRSAEEIRGEADGEAARIYNEAYSSDPEFFEFYNLLETYRQTVGSSARIVVPLDSPFAKYLLGVRPEAAPAAVVPPPAAPGE
jgi:membrane protease subunit HflC